MTEFETLVKAVFSGAALTETDTRKTVKFTSGGNIVADMPADTVSDIVWQGAYNKYLSDSGTAEVIRDIPEGERPEEVYTIPATFNSETVPVLWNIPERAPLATQGSVASIASTASTAAGASAGTIASVATAASVASHASLASESSRPTLGNHVSMASVASVASRASDSARTSSASSGSVASTGAIAATISRASSASVAEQQYRPEIKGIQERQSGLNGGDIYKIQQDATNESINVLHKIDFIASTASVASTGAVTSQASTASGASAGSLASMGAVGSISSTSSIASAASAGAVATNASQASYGAISSTVSIASLASQASQGTSAALADPIASRASSASSASVASAAGRAEVTGINTVLKSSFSGSGDLLDPWTVDMDAGEAAAGNHGTTKIIKGQDGSTSGGAKNGGNIELTPGKGADGGADGVIVVNDPSGTLFGKIYHDGVYLVNEGIRTLTYAVTGSNFFKSKSDELSFNGASAGNAHFTPNTSANLLDIGNYGSATPWNDVILDGAVGVKASSDPSIQSNYAHIYGKDVLTSCEVFVQDEGGTATQISAHSRLAPEFLYDHEDTIIDMIPQEIQYFQGIVRFTNKTRIAKLAALTDAEKSALTTEQKTCVIEETFAEYNTRTDNVDTLTVLDWDTVQADLQLKYDNERQAILLESEPFKLKKTGEDRLDILASLDAEIELIERHLQPEADIKKAKPAWLS
jgi:hypothetical protein